MNLALYRRGLTHLRVVKFKIYRIRLVPWGLPSCLKEANAEFIVLCPFMCMATGAFIILSWTHMILDLFVALTIKYLHIYSMRVCESVIGWLSLLLLTISLRSVCRPIKHDGPSLSPRWVSATHYSNGKLHTSIGPRVNPHLATLTLYHVLRWPPWRFLQYVSTGLKINRINFQTSANVLKCL